MVEENQREKGTKKKYLLVLLLLLLLFVTTFVTVINIGRFEREVQVQGAKEIVGTETATPTISSDDVGARVLGRPISNNGRTNNCAVRNTYNK
jgi:hypothetical protein